MIVLGILVLLLGCRISCVCADTSGEIVRKEKGQQQEEERCYRLYSHWQFS